MASSGTDDGNTRDQKCAVCNQPSTQRCSACRMVPYCGKECQKKDWPSHKFFCPLLYPEKDKSGKSVRAVFLPSDSPTPQFINVNHGRDPKKEMQALESVLGKGCYYSRRMRLFQESNGSYDRVITVFYRDNFMNDGSTPNICVTAITNGVNTGRWRGPLLVYQSDDVGSVDGSRIPEDPIYVDFEKKYCNQIVAFFLEQRNMVEVEKLECGVFNISENGELVMSKIE